jgi:hypothetical protein
MPAFDQAIVLNLPEGIDERKRDYRHHDGESQTGRRQDFPFKRPLGGMASSETVKSDTGVSGKSNSDGTGVAENPARRAPGNSCTRTGDCY